MAMMRVMRAMRILVYARDCGRWDDRCDEQGSHHRRGRQGVESRRSGRRKISRVLAEELVQALPHAGAPEAGKSWSGARLGCGRLADDAGEREPVVSLLQSPAVGVALELEGELADRAMRAWRGSPQCRERDREQEDEAVSANDVAALMVEPSVEFFVVERDQRPGRDDDPR